MSYEVILNLVCAALGTFGGFLLGRLSKGVVEEDMRGTARFKVTWMQFLGASVAVLAMLALIGAYFSVKRYERATVCQNNFNIAFSQAILERQDAASKDREANKQLNQANIVFLQTIRQPGGTQETFTTALDAWVRAQEDYSRKIQEAETARVDNPIPKEPACVVE